MGRPQVPPKLALNEGYMKSFILNLHFVWNSAIENDVTYAEGRPVDAFCFHWLWGLIFSADRIRFGLTFLIVCKFMSSLFCPLLSLSWGEPRVKYYCDNIDNQCNPKYYPPLLLFLNWKITKTCLKNKAIMNFQLSGFRSCLLFMVLKSWMRVYREQVSPITDWSGCLVQHSCHSSSL